MSDQKQKPKQGSRKGVWEEIQRFEDPDSNVALILSERVRGKPEISMQIVHIDDMGPNKFVPMDPKGAKTELKHIVYSLVEAAQNAVVELRAKQVVKKD